MGGDYFVHPRRFPENAEGAFYTFGHQCRESNAPDAQLVWCGDCCACEAPEFEAPDLTAPLKDSNFDTYFVRQPTTADAMELACRAVEVCCVMALRYGGQNREIIRRLNNNPQYCIAPDQSLWLTVNKEGELSPDAEKVVKAIQRRKRARWWQFWIK